MIQLLDLSPLSPDDKDALLQLLWLQAQAATEQTQTLAGQVQSLTARLAELEAQLAEPPKTPDNFSLPPSQGKKPNRGSGLPRRTINRPPATPKPGTAAMR